LSLFECRSLLVLAIAAELDTRRLPLVQPPPPEPIYQRLIGDTQAGAVAELPMDGLWHTQRLERGARLLFLNRTCFNGLWRENSKGKFNVPFGTYKNPRILDPLLLERAAAALAGVKLTSEDFADACGRLGVGDFVYFDPPYVPATKTASFTAYSASGFTMADQLRLVALLGDLAKRGVKAMLSNADTPETRELYAGFRVRAVSARRPINSDPRKRGAAGELIVMNFEAQAAAPARASRKPAAKGAAR